jgi:hypothetical protein
MYTLARDGLWHRLTHINEEHRAARTGCGQYLEPQPKDVVEDAPLTCLACLTTTDEDIMRAEREQHVDRDIRERGDEVVMRCGSKHLDGVDDDARCVHCGYRHRMEFKR